MFIATREVRCGNRLGTGRGSSTRQKNWYYGNRCTHAHEGGHRGARMKELGAWLGVNHSALSDRIRRNTMPIRRLRLFEAGTVTIHLGSRPGRGKSTGKLTGSLRQRKTPLGQEAAYAKRHDRVRPRLWPFELPLVTLSSSWRGFPFVSKWPEDRAEGLGVGFIHLKPIAHSVWLVFTCQ